MNSRQMEYAVLLAESGSFSQLAEKLNITQPALSKQILALEKELGIQLFDRSSNPIVLTAAGAHFVREAKALLYHEDQLLRSIEKFKSGDMGQLVIGATPFRCAYLLPSVLKKIREKFPGVRVRLVEKGSDLLRKDVSDGKFDFAVINLPVDESVLEVMPMEPDQLVLVVPEEMAAAYPMLENEIDFRQCGQLPFVVVSEGQEMRTLFDKLCARLQVSPPIAAEVVGLTTAWEMTCSGVAATLLPLQFVKRAQEHRNVRIIRLQNEVSLRQPAIILKRGQYVSPYAEYAISLLKNNPPSQGGTSL